MFAAAIYDSTNRSFLLVLSELITWKPTVIRIMIVINNNSNDNNNDGDHKENNIKK